MDTNELQITVPWGHLAVKCWGDEKNEPIVVIHGILDNLGSFDRLIPLLPNSFYYICIDLPGHGRSSHWSDTLPVNSIDNLLVYKIVVDYFQREKYIIMGHSWGAQIGIIFAQIYPEHVSKLVMLDAVYLFPKSTKYLQSGIRSFHERYFATIKKLTNNPPEYTYEEALDKLIVNRRNGFLTQEAAIPLLERMAVPLPNGKIKFSVDQKVKNYNNPNSDFRYVIDFLKRSPVKCPILMILANENDLEILYFRSIIIKQLRNWKNLKVKFVDANHDVHNVTPELVAPIISKFLLHTIKSKL